MKRLVVGLCLGLVVLTGEIVAAQPADQVAPIPSGWTALDPEPLRYGRESLWEYINGAAELFLTYRFQELVVADCERGDDMLSVCVYDMGTPLDAFGVFEAEKPKSGEVLAGIGSAAVLQAPYRGLMIKDRFYVKLEVGGGDLSAADLRNALSDVAAALPGETGLPPELAALPEAGRLVGSVAYAGSDFLGFKDLRGCLYADYADTKGQAYQLFVMTPSPAFLDDDRGQWHRSERDDRLLFSREIPYRGVVVLLGDEDHLLGVAGLPEVAAALAVLEPLVR